jgi:hypothetical protein
MSGDPSQPLHADVVGVYHAPIVDVAGEPLGAWLSGEF